jgi:hypothetical protein
VGQAVPRDAAVPMDLRKVQVRSDN